MTEDQAILWNIEHCERVIDELKDVRERVQSSLDEADLLLQDADDYMLSSTTRDNLYAEACANAAVIDKIDELIKEYTYKKDRCYYLRNGECVRVCECDKLDCPFNKTKERK